MSFESALAQELRDDTDISAIVSTRIYWFNAPQSSSPPYIVLTRTGGEPQYHLGGAVGLSAVRIEMNMYDTDHSGVIALREAVRDAIDGMNHQTIGSGANTIYVHNIAMEVEPIAGVEYSKQNADTHTYFERIDWKIWYTESVPSLGV